MPMNTCKQIEFSITIEPYHFITIEEKGTFIYFLEDTGIDESTYYSVMPMTCDYCSGSE